MVKNVLFLVNGSLMKYFFDFFLSAKFFFRSTDQICKNGFGGKMFLGCPFNQNVFLDRLCLFRKKSVFVLDRCSDKCFLGRFSNMFFSVAQKSMEKAIPKHRPAKNPASQKARQSPTKNRYKFQNNNAAR